MSLPRSLSDESGQVTARKLGANRLTLATAATTGIHWRPGFHDPDFLGWVIFVGYFAAACLCVRTALSRGRRPDCPSDRRSRTFWYVLTALLVLLGINKQLDLQTLMTEVGREAAKVEGWYQVRRPVQAVFVASLAVLSVSGLLILAILMRHSLLRLWLAVAGVVLLVSYVLVRAASFHHVDLLLGRFELNWLLELVGIACVALSAWLSMRSPRRHAAPPSDRSGSA